MSEYSIQPFGTKLFPLLKELFLSAFHTHLDEDVFNKKYNTKALGHDVIGFIAVHTNTNTAAAFYAVFPVKVLLNGKEVLAAQSGDTMTHPEHRRKGLFVKLATMTYEVCRQASIALVFGQPNKNSYHGLVNKLGFIPLDEIEQYDLKLRAKTLPLPKLFHKAKRFPSYLRFAKSLLKKRTANTVSNFINPLQTSCGKVLRNKAYLDYKKEPDKIFIRIDEVLLWIKLTDVLWIGDASNYENITPTVLKKLKRVAFSLGYNTIRFHFNKSLRKPAFLRAFKKKGSEASCFLYLNEEFSGHNFVLTSADFDTW